MRHQDESELGDYLSNCSRREYNGLEEASVASPLFREIVRSSPVFSEFRGATPVVVYEEVNLTHRTIGRDITSLDYVLSSEEEVILVKTHTGSGGRGTKRGRGKSLGTARRFLRKEFPEEVNEDNIQSVLYNKNTKTSNSK